MAKKQAKHSPKGNSVLDRVKAERDELEQRLSKLCDFTDERFAECKFLKLSPANRILLEQQKELMQKYRDVLDCRIELMEGSK